MSAIYVIGISVIFCLSLNSDKRSPKFIFLIVPFFLLCHSLLVGMRSDYGWGRTLVLEGLFLVEMSDCHKQTVVRKAS